MATEQAPDVARRQILRLGVFTGLLSFLGCTESAVEAGGRVQQPPGTLRPFADEMMDHCQWFAPALAGAIGKRALHRYVLERWQRAASFGFSLRGPIRTFIETSFLFGSSFDTDPQHAWAGDILRSAGEEMSRAERIWAGTRAYQDKVTTWSKRKALVRWQLDGRVPKAGSREGFVEEARAEVSRVFPEKAEYVGAEGLRALIGEAVTQATRSGLTEADEHMLVVGLFVALGHGCPRDPLFPSMVEAFHAPVSASGERADRLRDAALGLLRRQALTSLGG